MTDEFLDICDSSGRALGLARPRDEAHAKGLWHRTVHIWIVTSQGTVLFQKRALSKESFPGAWDVSAAGHISAGEEPMVAARREVFQELGVAVADGDLEYIFTTRTSSVQHNGSFVDNEFNTVYLVRKDILVAHLAPSSAEVAAANSSP